MERYSRNHMSITPEEQSILGNSHVLIAGCGGLGGFVTELLARTGVGYLTIVDGDIFQESNLNRQLFCTTEALGKAKTTAAFERISSVNPLVSITAIQERLTEENVDSFLSEHDVVVDALDNALSRMLLLDSACRAGIPLVHGAIAGWCGRVSVIYPGDIASSLFYSPDKGPGMEQNSGNLSFSASCVASFQAAETIKALLSKGRPCRNLSIELDLLSGTIEEVSFT